MMKSIRTIARAEGFETAYQVLREKHRRWDIDPESYASIGRFITKHAGKRKVAYRVRLLGQFTTTWLAEALQGWLGLDDPSFLVEDGAYDNIIQELYALESSPPPPDFIVVAPWYANTKLEQFASLEDATQAIAGLWRQAWALIEEYPSIKLVQLGYDWEGPGSKGYHVGQKGGRIGWIRAINQQIRRDLPKGAAFVDLDAISARYGKSVFYDRRRYFWTKQPLSEEGTGLLAKHIATAIRLLKGTVYKVLATDLDNTLWGGVVAETGPMDIRIDESPEGEAHLAYQQYLKELAEQGVLLAVSSKNNPADAVEPFEQNPRMLLKKEDFMAFKANWGPKSVALKEIAQELNLGLDSLVFVDDNPAEREEVLLNAPQVQVVPWEGDPADLVGALEDGLWFEALARTAEDLKRVQLYQAENARKATQSTYSSLDAYLKSLEMYARIDSIHSKNLKRVVQLIGKTNQFNLTTRRHPRSYVEQLLETPGVIHRVLSLRDKFGEYGLVSVLLCVPEDDSLRIDTWLMSCRVINRTVEHYVMSELCERAKNAGYQRLLGDYFPTAKNIPVQDLYSRMGFVFQEELPNKGQRFVLSLDKTHTLPATFVQPEALSSATH